MLQRKAFWSGTKAWVKRLLSCLSVKAFQLLTESGCWGIRMLIVNANGANSSKYSVKKKKKTKLLAVHLWFLIFKFKEKSKKLPCSSSNVQLIILGQTSRKVQWDQKKITAHVFCWFMFGFFVGRFVFWFPQYFHTCLYIIVRNFTSVSVVHRGKGRAQTYSQGLNAQKSCRKS